MKREDMPTFGQLGCSGFIVIGADGSCVSKKTDSFLNYAEKAFQNAESVIRTALEDAGVELNTGLNKKEHLYANGQTLRLEGLSSDPTLNGHTVTVIKYDTTNERFRVLLSDGSNRQISVLPCCLAPFIAQQNFVSENQDLNEIQQPNLIGCEIVDEEHAECTSAINQCLRSGTRDNLALLLICLEKHFEHEEKLALASGFGSITDGFSPMFSHAKDHSRILILTRAALERTDHNPSDINIDVIQTLAYAFLEHTKVFDSLLEGKL